MLIYRMIWFNWRLSTTYQKEKCIYEAFFKGEKRKKKSIWGFGAILHAYGPKLSKKGTKNV